MIRSGDKHGFPNRKEMQLIETIKDPISGFFFRSIPATFTHLYLLGTLRSLATTQGDSALIYFNEYYNASNYACSYKQDGTTPGNGTTSNFFGSFASEFTAQGEYGVLEAFFPNYRNTTHFRTWLLTSYSSREASQWYAYQVGGYWANTSPLTQVVITATSIGWKAGSILSLYGLP
jgi:hypothetical protein